MAQGYKDFTAGAVLTAADLEDYNQNQSIMRFASAAARDTALSTVKVEGMMAYLIDVNTVTAYSGSAWSTVGPVHGAWTAYTPTWSGAIGNGSVTGAYMRVGRMITFRATVTWGSTTSHAASTQTLTTPVTMAAAAAFGGGLLSTSSVAIGGTDYPGVLIPTSTTAFKMFAVSGGGAWTNTIPATFVNGNVATVSGTYEAAADA